MILVCNVETPDKTSFLLLNSPKPSKPFSQNKQIENRTFAQQLITSLSIVRLNFEVCRYEVGKTTHNSYGALPDLTRRQVRAQLNV